MKERLTIDIIDAPFSAEGISCIRGACCRDGDRFLIFVDSQLEGTDRAKVIAHELIHVALGHCGGACDVDAAERAVHDYLMEQESKR